MCQGKKVQPSYIRKIFTFKIWHSKPLSKSVTITVTMHDIPKRFREFVVTEEKLVTLIVTSLEMSPGHT